MSTGDRNEDWRKATEILQRIAARFNGRRPSRVRVEYLPDRKVTTAEFSNGDQFRVVQPGITPDNAWIFALAEELDLGTEFYCRNIQHITYQPLGPWWTARDFKQIVKGALKAFSGLCAKCGRDVSMGGFHIDHHLPKSLGYDLTKRNAVLLCGRCNCSKGAKLPIKFYTPDELARVEGILANA